MIRTLKTRRHCPHSPVQEEKHMHVYVRWPCVAVPLECNPNEGGARLSKVWGRTIPGRGNNESHWFKGQKAASVAETR